MASQMRTFTCPVCDESVRARGVEAAHPCPQRRTKTGRRQMTEMTPHDPEATE